MAFSWLNSQFQFSFLFTNQTREEYLFAKFSKKQNRIIKKGKHVDMIDTAVSVLHTKDVLLVAPPTGESLFLQFKFVPPFGIEFDYICLYTNKDMYYSYYQVRHALEHFGFTNKLKFLQQYEPYKYYAVTEDSRHRHIKAYLGHNYKLAGQLTQFIFTQVYKKNAGDYLISYQSTKKFWI